jgi:hypothetical protein
MSRPKGSKNKRAMPTLERYWRAEFGLDTVTKGDLRARKSRARKEKKAEDAAKVAAYAAEARKYLASNPPMELKTTKLERDPTGRLGMVLRECHEWRPTLKTRLTRAWLDRYDAGEIVIGDLEGFDPVRFRLEMEAAQKESNKSFAAFQKQCRGERLQKWLSQVDEVMELRKQRLALVGRKRLAPKKNRL